MADGNKVDEYIDFFRTYYIQRTPEQPTLTGVNSLNEAEPAQEKTTPKTYSDHTALRLEHRIIFVFVIPAQGVDKTEFTGGIEQYNAASEEEQLQIREVPVDEFRVAIVISGLQDRKLQRAIRAQWFKTEIFTHLLAQQITCSLFQPITLKCF